METKTVNLRDLPEELVRDAKACASATGVTLKKYATQALVAKVEEDKKKTIRRWR